MALDLSKCFYVNAIVAIITIMNAVVANFAIITIITSIIANNNTELNLIMAIFVLREPYFFKLPSALLFNSSSP